MGKNTIIAILFSGNTDNVHFSGQAVSGHVHVQTTEAVKMRGIRLEVHCNANVHWTEGSGDDEKKYSGKEELFNLYIDLMGSRSKDSELILQPGTYDLPFTFLLTPDLPSSFEHCIGHVRYKVKAVIDRPLRIDDKVKVALTVFRSLDLNHEPPQFREPVIVQSQNPASCCCCISGAPVIDLMLNKGLFIVGETILCQGEISNRTNTRIKHSTIALIQNIQFCATNRKGKIYHTTNSKNVLAKLERPAIKPRRSDSWSNIAFVIPPVSSSRLDGCNIINISYYVEVTAFFNACCSKSSARVDVIIGNVPLSYDLQSSVITSQPQPSIMPSAPPIEYPTPVNLVEKNIK